MSPRPGPAPLAAAPPEVATGDGPDAGTLRSAPATDVAAVAATCRARVPERDGVAMFLAVHDARPGRQLRVIDDTAASEGRRLAVLFDHYRAGLAAAAVDAGPRNAGDVIDAPGAASTDQDPTGAAELIEILVVLADQHLRARPHAPDRPT